MDTETVNSFGGYVYSWGGKELIREAVTKLLSPPTEDSPLQRIVELTRIDGEIQWIPFSFVSRKALLGEPPSEGGRYRYNVLAKFTHHRMVLVSHNRDIIEYLYQQGQLSGLRRRLRAVQFNVDSLVKKVFASSNENQVVYISAKIPPYEPELRSVIYYGSDLLKNSWFREALDILQINTCGFRKENTLYEITLGAQGSIGFYYSTISETTLIGDTLNGMQDKKLLIDPFYRPKE